MTDGLGFEILAKAVVQTGRCSGCGSCLIICPANVLTYNNDTVQLNGICRECGRCLQICARLAGDENSSPADESAPWGDYLAIRVARSTDPEIRLHCQDGGIVSTLLISSLEDEHYEGAVVSGLSSRLPLATQPRIAADRKEVLQAAGSRYTYSPNLMVYHEALTQGLKKLAFVGTPCQITALDRLQTSGLRKYRENPALLIGIFCSKTFTYEGLVLEKLKNQLGIDPQDVLRCQIKGKFQLLTRSGQIAEVPLKELQPYARSACAYCGDLTAEAADISVGAMGMDGWNIVIIRTSKGNDSFNKAVNAGKIELKEMDDSANVFALLAKMAKKQRERLK